MKVLFFRKPKKTDEEINYRQPRSARYRLTDISSHLDLTRFLKFFVHVCVWVRACEEIKGEKYCDVRDKSWTTKQNVRANCCREQKLTPVYRAPCRQRTCKWPIPNTRRVTKCYMHIRVHYITLWHMRTNTDITAVQNTTHKTQRVMPSYSSTQPIMPQYLDKYRWSTWTNFLVIMLHALRLTVKYLCYSYLH